MGDVVQRLTHASNQSLDPSEHSIEKLDKFVKFVPRLTGGYPRIQIPPVDASYGLNKAANGAQSPEGEKQAGDDADQNHRDHDPCENGSETLQESSRLLRPLADLQDRTV